MKKILILLVVGFIIPQVTFAAWWNPFTWSIFKDKEDKTLILENRIQELEKRLEKTASSSPAVTVATTTTPSVSKGSKIVPKAVDKVIKSSIITEPIVSYDDRYNELLAKYVSFRDKTFNAEFTAIQNISNQNDIQREYEKYLSGVRSVLKADTEKILSFFKVVPKTKALVETYESKFELIVQEYETKKNAYSVNLGKAIEVDRKNTEAAQLLEKENYVNDIKVKIAEINLIHSQLATFKATYTFADSSLLDFLNNPKKVDEQPLFIDMKRGSSGYYKYPFTKDNVTVVPNLLEDIQNHLNTYRSYLYLELTKNGVSY